MINFSSIFHSWMCVCVVFHSIAVECNVSVWERWLHNKLKFPAPAQHTDRPYASDSIKIKIKNFNILNLVIWLECSQAAIQSHITNKLDLGLCINQLGRYNNTCSFKRLSKKLMGGLVLAVFLQRRKDCNLTLMVASHNLRLSGVHWLELTLFSMQFCRIRYIILSIALLNYFIIVPTLVDAILKGIFLAFPTLQRIPMLLLLIQHCSY